MCGIAGLIRWHRQTAAPDRVDLLHWDQMLQAIAHRGPNSQGRWIDPRTHTSALLHARLAIIDLPGGLQPMGNEDGSVQVVFNGEIYNHRQLRAELRAAGHQFHSDHSDTEVLVHGWEQWHTALPTHLLGMFSVAVWDTRTDELFLARDRLGQKPLFFQATADGVAFASTINALLIANGGPPPVPMPRIVGYLADGYLAPPETIYPVIQQMQPGSAALFTAAGRRDIPYWHAGATPATTSVQPPSTAPDPVEHIRTLLTAAIESQLMADVPISCFLSGGIDSSIVAALIQQRQRAVGGHAITTLSVGFEEAGFDESPFAAAVARHIGAQHHAIRLTMPGDSIETLEWLMENVLGEPYADSSILPTYALANAARIFAPVALSGDGADESFGGYDRYRAMRFIQHYRPAVRFAASLRAVARSERSRRLRTACAARHWRQQYAGLTDIFSPADLAQLLPQMPPSLLTADALPSDLPTDRATWRKAMLLDQQRYLPGDVLWKVDSASMANALEVRAPFLDHRVVEFANGLADTRILNARQGKLLLRQAFGHLLPQEVFRRRKHGFALPIGTWFRTRLKGPLWDRLHDSSGFCRHYMSVSGVDQLLHQHLSGQRDHTHRLFALLMLEIWFRGFRPTITD